MLRVATSRIAQRGAGSVPLVWRSTSAPQAQAPVRAISSTTVCGGERRKHRDYSRYPRPRSTRPERPEKRATDEMMRGANYGSDKGSADLLESIRVTDEEISEIFGSIMTPERRREVDSQSMKHRSRAEFLEMRRQSKERQREPLLGGSAEPSTDKSQKDVERTKSDGERAGGAREPGPGAVNVATISDKTMEEMIYIDTRAIREMEEAKRAVIASIDSTRVDKLQDKVRAHATGKPLEPEPAVADGETVALAEVDEDPSTDLAPELTLAEFNHVIFANTVAGRVGEAMRAYELLREAGIKPDQTTFANLTIAHAKAGDIETAVSMFKKLEEEGLEPAIYSYGTLIRAYMEFDRVDDAFRVYETMKEREVWPNLPIYNSLIVACLKVGNFGRAWGVFEHLRYSISKPDEITFSIMIHACAKNGEVEKAMGLFDEMVSSKLTLTDVTFNSLIHACARRPDYFDEGFRLLQLMEAHGFQPDFYTYNTLIYACAVKKNLGLARGIFRDMLERSMNPENHGLLKIDSVTISNMLWAYSSYIHPVKNCSWRVAKNYETLAVEALAATRSAADGSGKCSRLGQILSKTDLDFKGQLASEALLDAQARSAEFGRTIIESEGKDVPKEKTDRQRLALIDALMPPAVPGVHNSIGSEASRLMTFYLDVLKGDVTSQLLNAYLSAMINNGRFYEAWRTFLGDFKRFSVLKDGWTFQRMIRLCARTRDVPSAWRVWDEFKAWRVEVERELETPGHEELKSARTMVYSSSPDKKPTDSESKEQPPRTAHGDEAALNRASQDMLALAKGLEFPGENAMPVRVAGGAKAAIAADREAARKRLGCDMKTEHAIYIEMITLLGSCGDFRAAVQLIREEKSGILEHPHKPNMEDVNSLYQNAVVAGDKHSALDIRGLCMTKPPKPARRALHRKWGTSFSWDLTDPQQRSLSRRFPEEFRRHKAPFKEGEYVFSRQK